MTDVGTAFSAGDAGYHRARVDKGVRKEADLYRPTPGPYKG
ncbi:hypothetical protein ACF09H_02215 [Streptomyces sp. NPDC014983]